MKIIILTEDPTLYSIKRFQQEAIAMGHAVQTIHPFKGSFPSSLARDTKNAASLIVHRASGYRLDSHDLAHSFYWESLGHKVINSPKVLLQWRDKELQYAQLKEREIPCIDSISLRGPWKRDYLNLLNGHSEFVVKTNIGNGGRGVQFVTDSDKLSKLCEKQFSQGDQKYLIQANLKGSDEFRLFYIGDHLIGGIKKQQCTSNHLHNLSSGASGAFIPPNQCPTELSAYVQIIKILCPFDYAAIDFLYFKNQFYFLEINLVPGFEALESLSGLNIAGEVLKFSL